MIANLAESKLLTDADRCPWCHGDGLYRDYHDKEWGCPQLDSHSLFEFLILEGAQAGLSWITILRKRQAYREAFNQFEPDRLARYTQRDINRLMKNSGIVRNQLKIKSAINNARCFLAIEKQGGFCDWIWSFVNHRVIINHHANSKAVPASTPEAEVMSREMKRAGFSFVGPTICYAFMQATGMVNDHLVHCHRHPACVALAKEAGL